MESVVLSLGSNLGDQCIYISRMEEALFSVLKGILRKSDLLRTEPVGVECQPWFINRVISGSFEGTAQQLLECTKEIEKKLGRDNKKQMVPRTADIDILLFGGQIINTSELVIPHPRILFRRFCLEGMNQIVPDWLIPGTGMSVSEHYRQMGPQIRAQKIFHFHEKGSDYRDGRP
ncbi:MAG: 2-amino-4-hydroxy-6-hydroxymethyldihydropteridine diphosphokinase [Fibrobacter sp.]|jgi:2-amino-4-hydroxy-6-hydroxymethyldihydropteridine diphosphokinase|nr:2-amino-4-hydroxy-6-hydroxymethyldihydropteridine diphosphokinase [Fibrobacter sp.]